jgi:uncharacterized protein (TIGR02466 family)
MKPISSSQLDVGFYFCAPIYTIKVPEFITLIQEVSNEYMEKTVDEIDEIYPSRMSKNFFEDKKLNSFCEFIRGASVDVLTSQGYDMQNIELFFSEMWTQEHHKHSLMERHTHGNGAQIVGFYFLDVPENSPRVIFHEPRQGKEFIDLPEAIPTNATIASRAINYTPEPGQLFLTNAWLPHSFGKHAGVDPLRFVHFNLNARYVSTQQTCAARAIIV